MDSLAALRKENYVPFETTVTMAPAADLSNQVRNHLKMGIPEADIARGLNISIHNVLLISLDISEGRRNGMPIAQKAPRTASKVASTFAKAKGIR